jgi:hypothetical protein
LSCPSWHFFFDNILIIGADLIDFSLDSNDWREESRKTFWDDNAAKVKAFLFSLDDDSDNIFNQLFEIPAFVLNFLTDDSVIGMGGESTFES